MRHAVLAASLTFGSPLRLTWGPAPRLIRGAARRVLAWLDARREREQRLIHGEP